MHADEINVGSCVRNLSIMWKNKIQREIPSNMLNKHLLIYPSVRLISPAVQAK